MILASMTLGWLAPLCAAPQDDPPIPPTEPPEFGSLDGPRNEDRLDVMQLAPPIHGNALLERAREASERGFAFLVSCQNKDGSWGSHDPPMAFLKNFGFATANRGSQDGVRLACTAIIAKALLRKPGRSEAEQAALDAAVGALTKTDRFAYHLGESFNTWGYGYKLDFLCDYLETPAGKEREEEVRAAADVAISGLRRFQQADGGWMYYANALMGSESMSFNTANFAETLGRAERLGLDVPAGMVDDAAKLVLRMQTIRGGTVYDARFLMNAGSVIELSAGSRTAASAEALAELGHWGPRELQRSLALFNEGENWLEDGRKLIQPHTAVHQISGYFFFYGYHYLAEFLPRLGDQVPASRWERNAWTMVRTQEPSGSWWDTPAAGYGDKWGTGFALMTLQRYFDWAEATDLDALDADGQEEEAPR